MRENTDQSNSEDGHFLHSVLCNNLFQRNSVINLCSQMPSLFLAFVGIDFYKNSNFVEIYLKEY